MQGPGRARDRSAARLAVVGALLLAAAAACPSTAGVPIFTIEAARTIEPYLERVPYGDTAPCGRTEVIQVCGPAVSDTVEDVFVPDVAKPENETTEVPFA